MSFSGPADFGVLHNASAYFISFQDDTELLSVVLNYTIFINEAIVGEPLAILLLFTRSPQIENLFAFPFSGTRTRDYILSLPTGYSRENSVGSFQESIYIRATVPEELYDNDIATFDLDLTTTVIGSLSQDAVVYYESVMFFTVHKSHAGT